MPQRHATGFPDDLDHGLMVRGNGEARGLRRSPGVSDILTRFEELGVRFHLASFRFDLWRFRNYGR